MGDPAPDFDLPALIDGVRKTWRLSAHHGHRIVLAFYPFNWKEVSARQLQSYQSARPRLIACHVETVGITVDSIMNTTAWEREIGPFKFPICSDFWPHGEVCRRYGLLKDHGEDAGSALRAVVGVNEAGNIAFRKIYFAEEVPALEDVLSALNSVEQGAS